MRSWMVPAAVLVLAAGCTHRQLQRSTVNQASTLTNLQYQQVLDNLAMLACDKDALPWHLKLVGGTVQVSDVGNASFAAEFGVDPARFLPALAGERGIVEQWSGVPTVEAGDLELLQLAYRKALDPDDAEATLEIYEKICELSLSFNVLLAHETVDKLIDYMKPRPNEDIDEYKDRQQRLKARNKELQEKLECELKNLSRLGVTKDKCASRVYTPLESPMNKAKQVHVDIVPALEEQIVSMYREICEQPVIQRYPITGRAEHNVHEIEQVHEKIKKLLDLADGKLFPSPWIFVGKKKDVPKCACYVGHYCHCHCDCHVWVLPDQRERLRQLVLTVLTLAPLEAQDMSFPVPYGGVAFSPVVGGGGRGLRR